MNFRVIAIALISLAGMVVCVGELRFPEPTLISCTPPPPPETEDGTTPPSTS
ncbi:hypothetical protein QM565_05975 [Geitlerinema splendidum]|nr:hypothetical protein [Geitlerinema splendidum]